MPHPSYVAEGLVLAVVITFSLRAVPFALPDRLRESALITEIGRRMPLGAIVILLVYCISALDVSAAARDVGPILGIAVTAAVHAIWRNALLSITSGSAVCLLIVNAL